MGVKYGCLPFFFTTVSVVSFFEEHTLAVFSGACLAKLKFHIQFFTFFVSITDGITHSLKEKRENNNKQKSKPHFYFFELLRNETHF